MAPDNNSASAAETPAQALQTICDHATAGRLLPFLDGLTSKAYVDLLHLGVAFDGVGKGIGFEIEPLPAEGESYPFRLRFMMEQKEIPVIATMTNMKGSWKISSLQAEA